MSAPKLISLLEKNNLNINSNLPWLNGESLLEIALLHLNFELADELVKLNAYIPNLSYLNEHEDILNWLLKHKPKLDIASIDKNDNSNNSLTFEYETMKAFEALLNFYNQDYDKNEEDEEFIVRIPQIIAEDLYKGDIISITKPMVEYFEEDIHIAVQEYIGQHKLPCYAECYSQ